MTLFLVTKADVRGEVPGELLELEPLEARPLPKGKISLTHNGLTIPVTVEEDDTLVIHVEQAEGDLWKASIPAIHDAGGRESTLREARSNGILDVRVRPNDHDWVLFFYADERGQMLSVERYGNTNEIFGSTLQRRK